MENIVAVGIDVSKGKSMVAVMRPGGEIVLSSFNVLHNREELKNLVKTLKKIDGEVRIIMEHTGRYYLPIARTLQEAGFFVSVVHAKLIHDFGNNTIRKSKTDKKDSVKIANYGLTYWSSLTPMSDEDDVREQLKNLNREVSMLSKTETMLKNNLIALIDSTFPGINNFFSPTQRLDGHEKWVDFIGKFYHCDCVRKLSLKSFSDSYAKWCKKSNGKFNANKVEEIYEYSKTLVTSLEKDETTKIMIKAITDSLTAILESVKKLQNQMDNLAKKLPEHEVVISMFGVGNILASQLIAEIGDVTRFHSRRALTAFAGLDSPAHQSGQFEMQRRKISKRGSPHLRRTLFRVAMVLVLNKPSDNNVYDFICKKRDEGKHYYVYMTAGANKFLRQYYGKVREFLLLREENAEVTKLEAC